MIFVQCMHDFTTAYALPVSLILVGLVGGFAHCTGMCGPFVLAQDSGDISLGRMRSALLLPYHLGRMTTYTLMAVLVHSFINLAFVFSDLKALIAAPMLVLAATIFLVTAFPRLSAVFPWASHIRFSLPYRWIDGGMRALMKSPTHLHRFGLGLLLGFMPCGLVVSALLASATAPNVFQAALGMMAFSLGTVPALVLVALGGQAIKGRFPGFASRLSRGAMVISSLWLFALAGTMVF